MNTVIPADGDFETFFIGLFYRQLPVSEHLGFSPDILYFEMVFDKLRIVGPEIKESA